MHCTQEPDMLMGLMDLGALPCFGIAFIGVLLIKLTAYMMTRDTETPHNTGLEDMTFFTGLLCICVLPLFIYLCFIAGVMSILRDLATSQPIHWF